MLIISSPKNNYYGAGTVAKQAKHLAEVTASHVNAGSRPDGSTSDPAPY